MQSQKAATAHFTSAQLQPFGFAEQGGCLENEVLRRKASGLDLGCGASCEGGDKILYVKAYRAILPCKAKKSVTA